MRWSPGRGRRQFHQPCTSSGWRRWRPEQSCHLPFSLASPDGGSASSLPPSGIPRRLRQSCATWFAAGRIPPGDDEMWAMMRGMTSQHPPSPTWSRRHDSAATCVGPVACSIGPPRPPRSGVHIRRASAGATVLLRHANARLLLAALTAATLLSKVIGCNVVRSS